MQINLGLAEGIILSTSTYASETLPCAGAISKRLDILRQIYLREILKITNTAHVMDDEDLR